MKVLLIDNYDSFLYNLRYELNSLDIEVTVCRNDIDYDELFSLVQQHDALILSPGPSHPKKAGHCLRLVKDFYAAKPILGICLGHQAIVEACGGKISRAAQVVHGKSSDVKLLLSELFKGLGSLITVARYHSLIATKVPKDLKIIATSDTGEVMAVEHSQYPVFGLQFHPESLMTIKGSQIIEKFKNIVLSKEEAKHAAIT